MKKRQPSEMEIEAQALLDRLLLPEARDWIWMAKCLMQEVMENNLKMGVRSDTKASFSGLGFSKSTSFPEYFSIGTWKHGFLHGHAIRIYRGKHLYTGQWDKGRWEGEGTVLSVTPDTGGLYSGRYLQSMSHGFGVKKWPNGASYKGEWKNNRINGKGTYVWATGATYDGEWYNSERSGFGVYVWPNGSKYVGQWRRNNFHGEGIKYYENGDLFKGLWENDLQHGKGEYVTFFGSKFEGEYVKGKKHGVGRFTHPDGTVTEGRWIENLPVEPYDMLHPQIKDALDYDRCTHTITGSTSFYAQLLYQCQTCKEEQKEGDGYMCHVCARDCHDPTHPAVEAVWTFGSSQCHCAGERNAHNACSSPTLSPASSPISHTHRRVDSHNHSTGMEQ